MVPEDRRTGLLARELLPTPPWVLSLIAEEKVTRQCHATRGPRGPSGSAGVNASAAVWETRVGSSTYTM